MVKFELFSLQFGGLQKGTSHDSHLTRLSKGKCLIGTALIQEETKKVAAVEAQVFRSWSTTWDRVGLKHSPVVTSV